jgi:hypothetical protein
VDTLVELRCIRRVSQERFHDPTPCFPPLAPGGTRSPASWVLSRRYDFLPPLPPRFVAFAWRYLGCTRSFRSATDECAAAAWSWSPGSSIRDRPRRRQDLPSSWRTPIVRLHMFHTDAGRTAVTRPLQCRGVALGNRTAKAPARGLSTLNSMAFGLTVYASQCGLPRSHARLASGRWSGATGRAFHPQGSAERFLKSFLHLIPPFPSLLGAIDST